MIVADNDLKCQVPEADHKIGGGEYDAAAPKIFHAGQRRFIIIGLECLSDGKIQANLIYILDLVEPHAPGLAGANGCFRSNRSPKNIRLLHILSFLTTFFTLFSGILRPFARARGKPRMQTRWDRGANRILAWAGRNGGRV